MQSLAQTPACDHGTFCTARENASDTTLTIEEPALPVINPTVTRCVPASALLPHCGSPGPAVAASTLRSTAKCSPARTSTSLLNPAAQIGLQTRRQSTPTN